MEMELTADMIALQGILIDLSQTLGAFTNIRYKGGNEDKIEIVVRKFEDFFCAKSYMTNKINDTKCDTKLNEIIFFLTINLELNNELEVKNCFHLTNVIPKLSKCLLINIIIELNLGLHYIYAVSKLPLRYSTELLSEFVPCLKTCEPYIVLHNVCNIEQFIVKKVDSVENLEQHREAVSSLLDLGIELLQYLNCLNADKVSCWKSTKLHELMGHTLYKILKLINNFPYENTMLNKLFENMMRITCSIMTAVTVDVFCVWAEVECNNQSLQCAISNEAYLAVEKIQNYKCAGELVIMLRTIAKKPKTISELINEADLPMIIKMINCEDSNQKLWFQALLNTQVFQNREAIDCVKRWSDLCTVEDVNRLLNLFDHNKNIEFKGTIIKCASNLTVSDLCLVTSRYFHKHGISNNLDMGKIPQQMTSLINKHFAEEDKDFLKNIYLLLLQNPEEVLIYLYKECLKKTIHCDYLRNTFESLNVISKIESLCLKCVNKLLENYLCDDDSKTTLVNLLATLVETQCLSNNQILSALIVPKLESTFENSNHKEILLYLQVINSLSSTYTYDSVISHVFVVLYKILQQSRFNFFEFSFINASITNEIIIIFESFFKLKIRVNLGDLFQEFNMEHENKLNCYYLFHLTNSNKLLLWDYIYQNHNIANYAETVTKLIQVLPCLVLLEWRSLFFTLEDLCGANQTMEMFTSSLSLLCHVAKRQHKFNEDIHIFDALKYCLQNFGIVLRECVSSKANVLEYEVSAAKCIMKLLYVIPSYLQQEGLSFARLISSDVLKKVLNDKVFVYSLLLIKHSDISQYLLKTILEINE